MGWSASGVAQYLGISQEHLQELRLEDSFPPPKWGRGGQPMWQAVDVRLWAATHLEVLRRHRRS
jgi:hypothetical protein